MRRPHIKLLLLLVTAAIGFAVPASALAGGCASCQQYTDPFGGSGTKTTTHTTTTHASAPTTSAAAPSTTAPTSTVAPSVSATTASSDPTATAATTGAKGKTLPFTGYNGIAAALLGAGLVLGGSVLRMRARRPGDGSSRLRG